MFGTREVAVDETSQMEITVKGVISMVDDCEGCGVKFWFFGTYGHCTLYIENPKDGSNSGFLCVSGIKPNTKPIKMSLLAAVRAYNKEQCRDRY